MRATGKYIGEGFDEPRLDTLFLTLPVWRGTIAQYVCRLHRLYDGKREVRVYDYGSGPTGLRGWLTVRPSAITFEPCAVAAWLDLSRHQIA